MFPNTMQNKAHENAKKQKERFHMKKFLAILLSVIMLFTLGVAAFAEGETEEAPAEMPANIGKLEGKIVISIDNTYIEP